LLVPVLIALLVAVLAPLRLLVFLTTLDTIWVEPIPTPALHVLLDVHLALPPDVLPLLPTIS